MMLTDDERTAVRRYLNDLFVQTGNPPGTVRALLGSDEGVRIVASVPPLARFDLAAAAMLEACELDGWRVRPPVLFRLLVNAMQADIATIRARIENPPANGWVAKGDPLDEFVLRTEAPFLDRTSLRDALRHLVAANEKVIVLVTGPSKSGKSYSAQLVDHASARLQSFYVARATVEKDSGGAMRPIEVAKALARGMGTNHVPDTKGTDPRSLEALAMWVMAERNQTNRRWWFVLDGFDDPDIPESTHVFLQQLALEATRGISWTNVSLVLLGYPKDRPMPNVRAFLIPEELSVDTIGKRELEAYFRFKLTASGRRPSKAVVTRASKVVLEAVDPGPDRLTRMNEKITELQGAILTVS